MTVQPVDESVLFGSFAKAVSELADGTEAEIKACPDRDMRECALLLATARRIGRMHYRLRQEGVR